MDFKDMIEEFQCPGCVCGTDPKTCERYDEESADGWHRCKAHVLGTYVLPPGYHVALGLPKGFCRPGDGEGGNPEFKQNQMLIRLWPKEKERNFKVWDGRFNIPVWALVKDGFLFVRTYMPRVNRTAVDVVEGGDLTIVPEAIDVSNFHDEMD